MLKKAVKPITKCTPLNCAERDKLKNAYKHIRNESEHLQKEFKKSLNRQSVVVTPAMHEFLKMVFDEKARV